jgi:hypothetical protein
MASAMQAAAWLADEARNASGTTTTSECRGSRKGRKPEAQARNEEYMIYIIVGKERVTEGSFVALGFSR